MVITLGYHRLSTMQADSDKERQGKIMLFWMCYWLDTSFAVRLGQAPVIRDYDITVPQLQYGKGIDSPFVEAFNYWTTISRLQCQVVEQLYSPLAQRQPLQERSRRAACLARELQETWSEREEVRRPSDRDTVAVLTVTTGVRCLHARDGKLRHVLPLERIGCRVLLQYIVSA